MDTTITLTNQTNLFITGIEKVDNVCPNEIIAVIGGKKVFIYGSGMEVKTLDLENKIFVVEGVITCLKYAGEKKGFLKRLFK